MRVEIEGDPYGDYAIRGYHGNVSEASRMVFNAAIDFIGFMGANDLDLTEKLRELVRAAQTRLE